MPDLGEQVEAKTALHTARSATSLSSIALCDEGLDQTTDLTLLIETHLTMLASIDDTGYVRNGDTSLGNVRCCIGPVNECAMKLKWGAYQ